MCFFFRARRPGPVSAATKTDRQDKYLLIIGIDPGPLARWRVDFPGCVEVLSKWRSSWFHQGRHVQCTVDSCAPTVYVVALTGAPARVQTTFGYL